MVEDGPWFAYARGFSYAEHGLEDAFVACATAEVAGEGFFDFFCGEGFAVAVVGVGGHDHAWGAEAALCALFFD